MLNLTYLLKKPTGLFLLTFSFILGILTTSTAQTNCQTAPCAAEVSGNGPEPCEAKVYCSNSGSVDNGLVACTPSADTDGCGVNASVSSLPTGDVEDFLDATLPGNCYSTGQHVQWIKYWLPVGINSIKIQGSGQLDAWAVFHVPGEYAYQDPFITPCDLSDLVYYGACSNMNQWMVITNPASDPGYANLYLIALIYDEPTQGTINFKTKECEAVCFPRITCPDDATFECDEEDEIADWLASYIVEPCNVNNWNVVVSYDQNAFNGCNGTGSALVTFTLKKGNTVLDYCTATLNIEDTTDPEITCPAGYTVQCIEDVPACNANDATATDNCGVVTVTCEQGPLVGGGCGGTVTNTYTARDECNNTASCTQVITVDDTTPPTGTCPDDLDQFVGCVEDIPCTIDPNSQLIQYLIDAIKAEFDDNCGEVIVTFDYATGLSDCEDTDGDGVYTVSRTVYFKVMDKCGNEAVDSPCPVNFSAPCYEFCTYTQGYYGNEGGNGSHLALITSLMNANGPIVIGLTSNNKSLTITSPECVIQFLPGGSTAQPLKPGNPTATYPGCDLGNNPTDGERLRNNLASNAIALQLNLWNNPGLGAVSLTSGCFNLPAIPGYNPATIQDLMNVVNQYLGGALGNSGSLGGALTNAVTAINEYWDECQTHDPCSGGYNLMVTGGNIQETPAVSLNQEKELSIVPNPVSSFASVNLDAYVDRQVQLNIFNNLGQLMMTKEVDWNEGTSVELDLAGFNDGLYVLHARIDNQHKVLRFVVTHN